MVPGTIPPGKPGEKNREVSVLGVNNQPGSRDINAGGGGEGGESSIPKIWGGGDTGKGDLRLQQERRLHLWQEVKKFW